MKKILLISVLLSGFNSFCGEGAVTSFKKGLLPWVLLKLGMTVKHTDSALYDYVKSIAERKDAISDSEDIIVTEAYKQDMQKINAMAGKIFGFPKMVILFPLIADMIENGILLEEEDTYQFTMRSGRSPFSLKFKIKKETLKPCVEGVLEHECGHLFHKHYERDSKFMVALKLLGTLGSINTLCKSRNLLSKESLGAMGVLYLIGIPNLRALFSGHYPDSVTKEKEADAFVSDNIEILQGLARFFLILDTIQRYIGSYDSYLIRLRAWHKGIEPHEFYEQNREWCEKWVFSSNPFLPSHPKTSERIATLRERVRVLQEYTEGNPDFLAKDRNFVIQVCCNAEVVETL